MPGYQTCHNNSAQIVTVECVFVQLLLYSIAFYNRPEEANDVVFGAIVYLTGMDVPVKYGDF